MILEKYDILLIEDDPNDIFLIQRAFRLARLDNSIYTVKDGDTAVQYLTGEGVYADRGLYPMPGLVILDLKLPKRSGLEVLAWMREKPIIKRIPVVILTSSNQKIDIDQAYDSGVNSYLIKPVAFDSLISMVGSINDYWIRFNKYPSIEVF
ncbi:MAG: response regulator [Leptolyngbya sp. SIO4C5]|uniref:response regulator n=1 Tax=Sphaerothrix gracilis TaxID=3151835 RepID=UPI0013C09E1D|nr:response regulator [Leptolyngbya sp. SIO4C5]